MRIAVISDIHGNVWALDAVLAEGARAGLDHVVNLGDCFWGPLAPRATLNRLGQREWPTVRGNQDRLLLEGGSSPTDHFTLEEFGDEGAAWLAERTRPTVRVGGVLGCHGTPDRDDVPLIERVEPANRLHNPGRRRLPMKDLTIVLDDRPGALAEMDEVLGSLTRHLAEEGINIEALYSDHDHRLVLVVDDVQRARGAARTWPERPSAS